MNQAKLLRAADAVVEEFDWGTLTWFAGGRLGNSAEMTLGRCEIRPGCENPRHHHTNCEEVLTVQSGRIAHAVEGQADCAMSPGDTITIPAGLVHNARNVGTEPAVLMIAFSSAERKTQGE